MKNKKLLIIVYIIIICLFLSIIFIKYSNTKKEIVNNISNQNIDDNGVQTTTLTSTAKNPIENNNIEATNIKFSNYSSELQVETTLKNNSSEDLNGFFIVIDFLDKNGKTVTSISQNVQEILKANGEIVLMNNITELDSGTSIVNAKITSLEKNTIEDTTENSFKNLE